MKAIILAAGRGSRLDMLTEKQPKCLLKVHNKALLQWQLDALKNKRIQSIGIVTGYQKNQIKHPLEKIYNSEWHMTNMVSSLIKANKWLEKETCIISYSDIIYSPKIINELIDSKGKIVISYDVNWKKLWSLRFENPLEDAERFLQKNGQLVTIGNKTNDFSDIQGQYMGLLKITPTGWQIIKKTLAKIHPNKIQKLDMTGLLANLLKNQVTINTIPNNYPWYEVDNQKDLQLYNSIPYANFMTNIF